MKGRFYMSFDKDSFACFKSNVQSSDFVEFAHIEIPEGFDIMNRDLRIQVFKLLKNVLSNQERRLDSLESTYKISPNAIVLELIKNFVRRRFLIYIAGFNV